MVRRGLSWALLVALCLWAVPASGQCFLVSRMEDQIGEDVDDSPFPEPCTNGTVNSTGQRVAFLRSMTLLGDEVWLRYLCGCGSTLMSVGLWGVPQNGDSQEPVVTANAIGVAFASYAFNLTARDTNGYCDAFLRSVYREETYRLSDSSAGVIGNGQSWNPVPNEDGSVVAFASDATNLVAGDGNWTTDVFVRDVVAGATERASVSSTGQQGNGPSLDPAISRDGRYVAFVSAATNLAPGDTNACWDIFVRDRVAGTTDRITFSNWGEQANGDSWAPAISADGRIVAFASMASNLVGGDRNAVADIFVRDLQAGTTERASISAFGIEANADSGNPALNYDGRYVVYESRATNLAAGPPFANGLQQIYRRDRAAGETIMISWGAGENGPGPADADCHLPDINYDGLTVVFDSAAGNLDEDASAGVSAVYWYDDHEGPWTFRDVPCFHWAYEEILACAANWIVGGYPDGTYRPDEQVTRDQMAVFIARAMCGNDTQVPPGPPTPSFSDVPADHWAYDHVEYLVSSAVTAGYPDGLYHPEYSVDRGQMAVFVARGLAGGDANVPSGPATPTFADVTPTSAYSWCYDHVEYIADLGVAQGYCDALYHPERIVTRDQMAVYVYRAFLM